MLLPVRTVAPATALLTPTEVKAQSRVDFGDDDAMLTERIGSVTASLDGPEGILGRALITQTWTQSFPAFADVLRLPIAPVQSATVAYLDEAGVSQPLADTYRLHTNAVGPYLARIAGATFPATATRDDAVTVTMVCGYGVAANVPADIRHAALLMVAHFYEHREAVTPVQFSELPMGAQWLLEKYRRVGV